MVREDDEPDEGLKRLLDARDAGDTELLLETLRSDPDYAHVAARLLAYVGEQRAVPLLAELLDSSRASARLAAVRALAALGAPVGARARLTEIALGDPQPSAREWACVAIGGYGDGEAASLLLGLLADPVRAVRLGAVRGLVAVGDPAAIEPIRASRPGPLRHPVDWLLSRGAYRDAVARLERRRAQAAAAA